MKGVFSFIFEVLKIGVIAALIVIPIRCFLFQPFLVKGQSMEPNFEHGDYLIVDEISYRFREPERGEVIVFKYPRNPSQRFIKRIVGLPGETIKIEDGRVTISNKEGNQVLDESRYLSSYLRTSGNTQVSLQENEYFVLGDNRNSSLDSRSWGSLPRKDIVGRVYLKIAPFAALAKITIPSY